MKLRTIPFLHGNGLTRMDSVLAYDHMAVPTASARSQCGGRLAYGQQGSSTGRVDVGKGQTRADSWRTFLLQVMRRIACGGGDKIPHTL